MRRLLGTLFVLCLCLAAAPQAVAGGSTWTDTPGDAQGSYLDIKKVTVSNNAKGVRIKMKIHPIDWDTFSPVGSLTLLIDTGGSAGPEFRHDLGLPGEGHFAALKGNRAWQNSWHYYPYAGTCGRTVKMRWKLDRGVAVLRILPKRGCLWHPRRVRINLKTVESGKIIEGDMYLVNDPPLVDHFPARRTYTPWVKYARR